MQLVIEITPGSILNYIRAFIKAFRPLSVVIAFMSCGLGVALAWKDGSTNYIDMAVVMAAGLSIQCGANLVNDFFEFKQKKIDDKIPELKIFGPQREFIEWFIFLSGIAFFGLSILLGLYLVWKTGFPLMALGIAGLIGGYFYTGEPFNYKRRGLGVVLVFLLMGTMMVAGSYYAVAGKFSLNSIILSLPLSAMVSNILLANELRDYNADTRHGLKTMTVRRGYNFSLVLFCILFLAAYAGCFALYLTGFLPRIVYLLPCILFIIPPVTIAFKGIGEREAGPAIIPFMMLHHLAFGALLIISFLF
jgi:1,4-dihydroxy-2-naphthoate polyprenyltransferase